MRHAKKTLLLGTVLTLALTNASWSPAQTGPVTPPQNNTQSPGQTTENPLALSHEVLGSMLRAMGHDPKERSHNGGSKDYVITLSRGTWNLHVRLAFSPNKRVLWFTTALSDIPASGGIPPAVMSTMLTRNGGDIGKAFFCIRGTQLVMNMALDNHDLTAVELRQNLHDFVEAIGLSEQHWNPQRWTPQTTQPAPAPNQPAPAPAPANDLFGRSR